MVLQDIKKRRSVLSGLLCIYLRKRREKRKKQHRTVWVKQWIDRRKQLGVASTLLKELQIEDRQSYQNFLRMNFDTFQNLLGLVEPLIHRQQTNMRESISANDRLALTLRFLASGNSYQDLCYLYRIGKSTISTIIPEVCAAIYDVLSEKYMKTPDTPNAWKEIADGFLKQWNFPNCLGAMDGKHINLKHPIDSGSYFYNYKNNFSIVLLALVDSNYKFTYVDVGCNGRVSDGGIFRNCTLKKAIENNTIGIPENNPLPGQEEDVPYVIITDEAFPLKSYIMKPYPGRLLNSDEKKVFNYRLSRARRMVESTFGILVGRFRIFEKALCLDPEKAEILVLACCALHNYLTSVEKTECVIPNEDQDEVLNVNGMRPLVNQCGNHYSKYASQVREEFCNYFCTNGQLPWQWDDIL